MPIFEYKCQDCGKHEEAFAWKLETAMPPDCECTGEPKPMTRIIAQGGSFLFRPPVQH